MFSRHVLKHVLLHDLHPEILFLILVTDLPPSIVLRLAVVLFKRTPISYQRHPVTVVYFFWSPKDF